MPLLLDVAEALAMKRSRSYIGNEMTLTYRQMYEEIAKEGGTEP